MKVRTNNREVTLDGALTQYATILPQAETFQLRQIEEKARKAGKDGWNNLSWHDCARLAKWCQEEMTRRSVKGIYN